MMATHADSRSFVEACVFLTLLVAVHTALQEVCDKTKCPGPLEPYEALSCTPVYKNPDDCCAYRYNCSHLKELSKDKCYTTGHEYSLGEILRPEHRNLCDQPCVCAKTFFDSSISSFHCGVHLCPQLPDLPNCYYRKSNDQCCAEIRICLKEGETRPTCEVDGKVYEDGESFQPESDPEVNCICMPGYKGENVEPFCKKRNRRRCHSVFDYVHVVLKNCTVFLRNFGSPYFGCSPSFRCQYDNDAVIHNHDSTKSPLETDGDGMCHLGNLTLHIGDELRERFSSGPFCEKCVCEVPPMLTCQYNACDKSNNSSKVETQNVLNGGDSEAYEDEDED